MTERLIEFTLEEWRKRPQDLRSMSSHRPADEPAQKEIEA